MKAIYMFTICTLLLASLAATRAEPNLAESQKVEEISVSLI